MFLRCAHDTSLYDENMECKQNNAKLFLNSCTWWLHLKSQGIKRIFSVRSRQPNNNSSLPSQVPGYSVEMWEKSLQDHEYPYGPVWKALFREGKYRDPERSPPAWVEHRLSGDIVCRWTQDEQPRGECMLAILYVTCSKFELRHTMKLPQNIDCQTLF